MEYAATFYTHSGAVKYQRFMKRKGIDIELMPVPRKFSSSCGIGARFTLEEDIRNFISDDIEKLFLITGEEDKLIYRGDRD